MSRHVVLLRRDPSLGLALRALLHGTGRVTELINIQAWSALQVDTVDAVVIDLPVSRRKQAVDLIRSRFKGRLVLVLDPIDDPAGVPSHHHCSVVQRPFEIVELWHLVTTDPEVPAPRVRFDEDPGPDPAGESPAGSAVEEQPAASAVEERPAAAGEDRIHPSRRLHLPGAGCRPDGAHRDPGRRADDRASASEEAPGPGSPSADDASTWRWRGRRYGPATAVPPDPVGGEQGTGGPGTGGAKPGPRTRDPARPSAPAASAGGTPAVPAGPQDQPTAASEQPPPPDPGATSRSEGRRWGALPRRSADPRSARRPAGEARPGAARSDAPDPTDPHASGTADPVAAKPAGAATSRPPTNRRGHRRQAPRKRGVPHPPRRAVPPPRERAVPLSQPPRGQPHHRPPHRRRVPLQEAPPTPPGRDRPHLDRRRPPRAVPLQHGRRLRHRRPRPELPVPSARRSSAGSPAAWVGAGRSPRPRRLPRRPRALPPRSVRRRSQRSNQHQHPPREPRSPRLALRSGQPRPPSPAQPRTTPRPAPTTQPQPAPAEPPTSIGRGPAAPRRSANTSTHATTCLGARALPSGADTLADPDPSAVGTPDHDRTRGRASASYRARRRCRRHPGSLGATSSVLAQSTDPARAADPADRPTAGSARCAPRPSWSGGRRRRPNRPGRSSRPARGASPASVPSRVAASSGHTTIRGAWTQGARRRPAAPAQGPAAAQR